MTTRLSLAAASTALIAFLAVGVAKADDEATPDDSAPASYPYIEGTLDLELGDDFVVESDDDSTEINDLYFSGSLAARMHVTEILSLNAGLTLEAVEDPLPFEDRFFGGMGLYMDTLNVQAEYNGFSLLAGKFGPGFGTAWDNTPGVFGTAFAEDYELSEQIGVGLAYTFDAGDAGQHTLGANVFYADNTFLSDSLFTRRGRTSVSDGGVGNTGTLDNFSLTLDGSEFAALPGFSYHLGYRHLSAGVTEDADENGFVGGVAKETELANGMVLGLNGELAYFDDAAGVAGDEALYATAGLSLTHGSWHGELAGTLRKVRLSRVDFNDHIVQASVGYEFENGIDLSAGYAHVREAAVDAHVIGVRLTKSLEFSTRN